MGTWDVVTYILVILCSFGHLTNGIPYRLLFPFGEEAGDSVLERGDDKSSSEIQLTTPIYFYDRRYSSIFVNNNGHLSFETELPVYQANLVLPIGFKVIAGFLADIDTTNGGAVYYRETQDIALIQRAALTVSQNFDTVQDFIPSSLFIATWDKVGFYNANNTLLNTFQIVIASDGSNSFACFHYLDDGIQWITSSGKYSVPDPPAQAGFDSSESVERSLILRYSATIQAWELEKDSNVNEPGVWMYQIGNTGSGNVIRPLGDTDGEVIFNPYDKPCVQGSQQCHLSARCNDFDNGFCCECLAPSYGNGKNCITQGTPQRLNGKVNGMLNNVSINDLDMHSFVVTSDGRAYTAIRVPPEIGTNLLTLNTINGIIGWMFALTMNPRALNGYMFTGGEFNRTATIRYRSGEAVQIRQTFFGHDAQDNFRMETYIDGNVPPMEPGAKVTLDNYNEEYQRVAPGRITSSSNRTYRVNQIAYRYTWDQTINFQECPHDTSKHVNDVMRLSSSRNVAVYNSLEEYLQFAMASKLGVLHGSDPCRDAPCGEHSECTSEADGNYRCECRPGFTGDGLRCEDIDECRDILSICDENARCYNVPGSFQCQCLPGFRGDGRTCTRNVQRCGDDVCHEMARCVYNSDINRPMCECRPGYRGDGVLQCTMQQLTCNEVDICHEDADCVYDQVEDTYKCECGMGYSGDGTTCEAYETDQECQCSENARCVFDPNSLIRRCQCNIGYTGDGKYCTPIDVPVGCENCHAHAHCVAASDRYLCECLPGYSGDGYTCEEVDCKNRQMCDENADCVNDPFLGGYRCLCRNGFIGDGLTCSPDDCSSAFNCDANADCVPDPRDSARSVCRCREGYDGDGYRCVQREIPCNQVNNCDANAQCLYNQRERSYKCRCNQGYEGNGFTCRVRGYDCRNDPRICDPNANCVLNVDTFICVCNENFRGDGRRCIAMDDDNNYLLFARGYSIQKVPFTEKEDDKGERILYDSNQLAIGIDSDCDAGTFYWTDVMGGAIRKANLDGTESSTVISGLKSPEGVAIDWLSRNIYWTDSELDIVAVSRLDGTYTRRLFNTVLVNPRAIVVDPSRGLMYWTDWNRGAPRIEKANMDGQHRTVLVESDLGLPNGLTIDYHTQQICWGDAGTRKIECIRDDGIGRRTVTEDPPYPFDLTILSNKIYFSDWTMAGIGSVQKTGGDLEDLIPLPVGGNGKVYGVTSVRAVCPRVTNACARDNGGCVYLCLPTPNGGRTCVCPDGIDENGCNEVVA